MKRMSKIEFLDHVAIRVNDPEKSALWYANVLGLRRYQPEEWKPVPIMMLAGNSGIAIFSDGGDPVTEKVKEAFHIAFRASDLEASKELLESNGVSYVEEDHVHFHSIYFNDVDGYRIEITVPADTAST